MSVMDIEVRFMAKVEKQSNGCWMWTAVRDKGGYGLFKVSQPRRQVRAHRWAYEHWVGPIPTGLHMDHFACDTPSCVNPNHVRPVTIRENNLRSNCLAAIGAAKTHCPQRHPYDGGNTYLNPQGSRECRTCKREGMRRSRAEARLPQVATDGSRYNSKDWT